MMKRDVSRWELIEPELEATKKRAGEIHVSMVLNEPERFDTAADYSWHSVATEYLDDTEKSELMTGLRDAGFAITVYQGETAFIGAVLSDTWEGKHYASRYVFNTTGSGIGRARTSLVPSFCDLRGIPLCSADGLTAALLENKFYSFRLLEALGYVVPKTSVYVPRLGWNGPPPAEGCKVLCKPSRECSSIGIDDRGVFVYEQSRTRDIEQLAHEFRQPILVQEFISGYEVEVPIFPIQRPVSPAAIGISISDKLELGDAILANKNIVDGNYGFYDFSTINERLAEQLKTTTEAIYQAFCLSGFVRIDWRITNDGRAYITDFNTPPHLTLHSSCAVTFELGGHVHADLMTCLVTAGRLSEKS